MRAGRLLSILILLQLRARLTAESLAQEFGVSVRTIYRDIDELSGAGIPVRAERGPGGGFALIDGYRTRLTGLAADEAEAMFVLGLPGAATQLGLGPASSRLSSKLLVALPGEGATLAGRLQQRFHVDPVDWYREAEPAAHLPALTRAVLDQRVAVMTYASWTSVREHRVEPLGVVLKAGTWYVVGRCGARLLTFRVGGIRSLQVLDAHFERPADFDLAAYWVQSLARFEAQLRPGTALLRASPEGLQRLADLGRYAAEAVRKACKPTRRHGWSKVVLPIENVGQAARLVLSLGPHAEVLAPLALRERVHAWATAIGRRHAASRRRDVARATR